MSYELRVIHNAVVLVVIAVCVVGIAAFCHSPEGLWSLPLVFCGVSYQNKEKEPEKGVVDSFISKITDKE